MIDKDSKEIRRFFDLLGSTFCGLIYSYISWREFFRYSHSDSSANFFLPLFLLLGLTVYVTSYLLLWKLLNTKFLRGYFNFIFISVLGVTISIFFGLGIEYIFMRISSWKRAKRKQLLVFPNNVSAKRRLNELCWLFGYSFSRLSS